MTYDTETFACCCGQDRMQKWNGILQEVADEVAGGDVARIATGVVYGLQNYSATITAIPSDQWAAIEAHTDDDTYRVRIQCDLIEHGLAALYLAFKDRFPNGYRPYLDDDDESERTGMNFSESPETAQEPLKSGTNKPEQHDE